MRQRQERGLGGRPGHFLRLDRARSKGRGERRQSEAAKEQRHGVGATGRMKVYTTGRLRVLRSSVKVSTVPLAETL